MAHSELAEIVQSFAALVVAGGAIWGASSYGTAADAEARLKQSAAIDNEIKMQEHLRNLVRRVNGWVESAGGTPGVPLAEQRATIGFIEAAAELHKTLRRPAILGLETVVAAPQMNDLHDDAKAAIGRIRSLRD